MHAVQYGPQRQVHREGVGRRVPDPAAERRRLGEGLPYEGGPARAGFALHGQAASAALRTPAHPFP